MAVAAVCFLVVLPASFGNRPQRGDIRLFLVMILCEPCLYFLFEMAALRNTEASQAGMIVAMLPILVAFSAAFFLKEHITVRVIVGCMIAVAGAVLLSLAAPVTESAPNPVLGNFLEFLAMVTATAYTLLLKHFSTRYRPIFLASLQAYGGVVFFFPLLWFPDPAWPTQWPAVGVIAVLYLGVFVTFLAYVLFINGIGRIPVSQASAFTNLIPVFVLIFSALLLGERLNAIQLVACAMIFTGLIISQKRRA
jgi:drug/metabolite transporter (DMT)-like permease